MHMRIQAAEEEAKKAKREASALSRDAAEALKLSVSGSPSSLPLERTKSQEQKQQEMKEMKEKLRQEREERMQAKKKAVEVRKSQERD